jgi:dimethylargininase
LSRIALTREVSPAIGRCELTFAPRAEIDLNRAREQHAAYEDCLRSLGCRVERLPADPDLPDSVFVEDVAVVVDELAVITRPGAAARRGETAVVAAALARYRRVVLLEEPATLDGGDVLRVGRTLFVGRTRRTNQAGYEALAALLEPLGYEVRPAVEVTGCLHLKSAVTQAAERLLLVNPDWVDLRQFPGFEVVSVHPDEPFAANVLSVSGAVVAPLAFPRTRDRLLGRGARVVTLDASELAKAEGALTCCSLLLEARGA